MKRSSSCWLRILGVLVAGALVGPAIGCESGSKRTEITPPSGAQAWAGTPVWFEGPDLLVAPDDHGGGRRGRSGRSQPSAAAARGNPAMGAPTTQPAEDGSSGPSEAHWVEPAAPRRPSGPRRAAFPGAPAPTAVYDSPQPTTRPSR